MPKQRAKRYSKTIQGVRGRKDRVSLTFEMAPETRLQLIKLAQEKDMSMAALLRGMVRKGLNEAEEGMFQ